jgi:hypothetical protein
VIESRVLDWFAVSVELQRSGETGVVEVERVRAPDVAPPGCKYLGVGALLGGEQGDDLVEDSVGYQADAIGGVFTRSGLRTLADGGSHFRHRRGLHSRPLPLLHQRNRTTKCRWSSLLRPHGRVACDSGQHRQASLRLIVGGRLGFGYRDGCSSLACRS